MVYIKNFLKFIAIFVSVIIIIFGIGVVINTNVPKDKIINGFNENYDCFSNVARYFENENGYFEISLVKGKLSIENRGGIESKQTLEIDDEKAYEEIFFILDDLKYESIELGKDEIYFRVQTKRLFDDGIRYTKDGKIPDGSDIYEHLKGNWYYTNFGHI